MYDVELSCSRGAMLSCGIGAVIVLRVGKSGGGNCCCCCGVLCMGVCIGLEDIVAMELFRECIWENRGWRRPT
jgi:hypothetical protein